MTYYILHQDRKFVGVTPFDWIALPGVSIETIEGSIPDLNRVYWDSDELRLIEIPNIVLTKLEFMSRFTLEERTSIRNSTDSVIIDAMELLNVAQEVILTDTRIVDMVNYFASVNLLQASRVQELLT